jgi:hypothetical protein
MSSTGELDTAEAARHAASMRNNRTQPVYLALVLLTFTACLAGVLLLPGCSSPRNPQSFKDSATAVYPKTVAALDGLKVTLDNSPSNVFTESAAAVIALALGGLGVWARITHGTVAKIKDRELATADSAPSPRKTAVDEKPDKA